MDAEAVAKQAAVAFATATARQQELKAQLANKQQAADDEAAQLANKQQAVLAASSATLVSDDAAGATAVAAAAAEASGNCGWVGKLVGVSDRA